MTHPQVPWQFQDMDNGFIRFSKGSIVPNRLSGKNVGSWSKGRSPKSFLAVWWSWGRLLPRSSAEWAELVWLIWFPLLKDGKGMTYTRLSHIWLLASLWTVAHQASLSTEFSRPRNWCFQIVVLEKTLENPLACEEIKPVNPKGNQPWISIGRTDAKAEVPILWPPDAKSWLIRKDPDAGKDWRQEEKGMTEDEMVGWHHQLNGHEFEQTLGDSEGQGSLACYGPWVQKELYMT